MAHCDSIGASNSRTKKNFKSKFIINNISNLFSSNGILITEITNNINIIQECYGVADEEKVKRVKEIYDKIGISNIYFDYEEETHNLLNTYIQQLSSNLPPEYFLYLLATSCSKVGRKH